MLCGRRYFQRQVIEHMLNLQSNVAYINQVATVLSEFAQIDKIWLLEVKVNILDNPQDSRPIAQPHV
jgi:hypothetical protein